MRVDTELDDGFGDRPTDPEVLARAVERGRGELAALERKLADEVTELELSRLGRVLNRLAKHCALASNHRTALEHAERARDVWERLERRRPRFLADLRLARIRHRCGRTDAALRRLDELVAQSGDEPFSVYRDFALETRGRVRAEAGRPGEAVADFDLALEIRRRRDRKPLLARTRTLRERAASLETENDAEQSNAH